MKKSAAYIYDGSFNGYLSVIYTLFKSGDEPLDIRSYDVSQHLLYPDRIIVQTDMDKAKRVWNGLQKKDALRLKYMYFAFLSEQDGIEILLYRVIREILLTDVKRTDLFYRKVLPLAEAVTKEKEALEKNLLLNTTDAGFAFSFCSPRYNILPLICRHIRQRIPGRNWKIFDTKRDYGMYCNFEGLFMIPWDTEADELLSRYNKTLAPAADAVSTGENTGLHITQADVNHPDELNDRIAV